MTTPAPAGQNIQRVFTSKAETKAFYNKISKFYDFLADKSEAPMRHVGLDRLNAKPGERILEIGFGTGHCLITLGHAVGATGKIFGIDLSDAMLQLAEENLQRAGLSDRVELKVGDGLHLPYADGALDGVFTSFTLELFDTPEIPKVLAECKRVLKTGGRLAVVAVSKEGEKGIVIDLYEWSHRHFPNLVDCRPIFARRSMEEAGFRIESAEKKSMWVPVEIVLGVKE